MSESLAIVPVNIEDQEKAVVDRFIQASRNIAPTVQVSLAKRFVRPGSNRVVCLAAHTSVPLNEDELASVSDLALRLSDGTNVKLSLSFFNDTTECAEIVPLTRCIYDPQRYEPPRRSSSGIVWTGLLLAALASACFFLKTPITPLIAAHLPLKQSAGNPLKPADKITVAPKTAAPPQVNQAAAKPVAKSPATAKKTKELSSKPRPERKEHPSKGSLFIPPPPPTAYSPVYAAPPQGFDPLQMMSPMAAPSKPAATSPKPTVTKWLPRPDPVAPAAVTASAAPDQTPKTKTEPPAAPASNDNASPIHLERIVPPAADQESGAPLPGSS